MTVITFTQQALDELPEDFDGDPVKIGTPIVVDGAHAVTVETTIAYREGQFTADAQVDRAL